MFNFNYKEILQVPYERGASDLAYSFRWSLLLLWNSLMVFSCPIWYHCFQTYREIAQGLMKYQPDIIISVHPLMQHVPLRVLRSKGLLKKIVFTTVITDLSTCHPTWSVFYQIFHVKDSIDSFVKIKLQHACLMFRFHKLVTRCYCPSTEVAKRAQKAGLETSQIKVYGLPVRPSFVKPVRPKVGFGNFAFPGCSLLLQHIQM